MFSNTILALNKWLKIYKILPKWRNFAKSGHTDFAYHLPNEADTPFNSFWFLKNSTFDQITP